MLFHEDRHIKHAITHRHGRALASLGSIFSRYSGQECANSVQLLIRLQAAILQPCASYGCEVWAPSAATLGPMRDLQQLQLRFLRRACHVGSRVPADIIFEELQLARWRDFWWRQVLRFWTSLAMAHPNTIRSRVLHDSIELSSRGCTFNWAAQVFAQLRQSDIATTWPTGPLLLLPLSPYRAHAFMASFAALPPDPRSSPSAHVKSCTYHSSLDGSLAP